MTQKPVTGAEMLKKRDVAYLDEGLPPQPVRHDFHRVSKMTTQKMHTPHSLETSK